MLKLSLPHDTECKKKDQLFWNYKSCSQSFYNLVQFSEKKKKTRGKDFNPFIIQYFLLLRSCITYKPIPIIPLSLSLSLHEYLNEESPVCTHFPGTSPTLFVMYPWVFTLYYICTRRRLYYIYLYLVGENHLHKSIYIYTFCVLYS